MKLAPFCSKCKQHHFNFFPCKEEPAEPEPEPRAQQTPRIFRQPLPEGEREWGDQLNSYEQPSSGGPLFHKKGDA